MPKSQPISIKVITGSVRQSRFNRTAAEWIVNLLEKREDLQAELIDLADFEMPFFNEAATPSSKQEPYKHPIVAKFTQKIAEGDGFVMVTPEYNHGTSGVLKNAIDWVYPEWNQKAVGFVSYGSVGGARAIEHLRLYAVELQMAPVRQAVHMLGNDYFPVLFGKSTAEELFSKYQSDAETLLDQLLWWTRALKSARTQS